MISLPVIVMNIQQIDNLLYVHDLSVVFNSICIQKRNPDLLLLPMLAALWIKAIGIAFV